MPTILIQRRKLLKFAQSQFPTLIVALIIKSYTRLFRTLLPSFTWTILVIYQFVNFALAKSNVAYSKKFFVVAQNGRKFKSLVIFSVDKIIRTNKLFLVVVPVVDF